MKLFSHLFLSLFLLLISSTCFAVTPVESFVKPLFQISVYSDGHLVRTVQTNQFGWLSGNMAIVEDVLYGGEVMISGDLIVENVNPGSIPLVACNGQRATEPWQLEIYSGGTVIGSWEADCIDNPGNRTIIFRDRESQKIFWASGTIIATPVNRHEESEPLELPSLLVGPPRNSY